MKPHSQFRLLSERRFLPFFLTQFAGAFNDNLFKNALLLLITFSAGQALGLSSDILVNMAAGLFILPFFLFSAIGGQLADKYEKSRLIRQIKMAEVLIMAVAAVGLWLQWYGVLMAVLFVMGAQSAFFGPVKYAILPQNLHDDELVGGNALVEMGTFVAILLGTLVAGMLMTTAQAAQWVALGVLLMAALGYLAARQIPKAPAADAGMPLSFNLWRETWVVVRIAREKHSVLLAIMAISWFWFIGAAYLTQFPNFAKKTLGGDATVVTLLLAVFTMGIALGSTLCEKLSRHRVELGIVPLGSLGLSVSGLDLYFASPASPAIQAMDWLQLLADPAGQRVLLDLAGIGVFGGLFIVPLYAFVQQETPADRRARVIAALNILNALFMVVSAIMGGLMLGVFALSIPGFFCVLAIMNLVVVSYVYQQVPEFALRFLIWMLSHTIYRVRHEGLQEIPDEGPAVLVCNHVSYMDALIIAGAVRRPVRFVMDSRIFESKALGWFFRLAKTIPIAPKSKAPAVYAAAFESISQELQAGHLVCIFPEGKLTSDGQVDVFKGGIETIISRNPVPVIPMALQGLWGSFFSHKGGPALTRPPKRFWSAVGLRISKPWPPEGVTAAGLEQQVKQLRGDWA